MWATAGLQELRTGGERLRKTPPGTTPVCTSCSRDAPFKSEKELLANYGTEQRVTVMSDISDTVMAQLYRNARLFVYPSLYEGFGIPILEAFAQQCPVVLSRASCFPEVAADAAECFDATSADGLVSAMKRVLTDDSHRHELTEKGTADSASSPGTRRQDARKIPT